MFPSGPAIRTQLYPTLDESLAQPTCKTSQGQARHAEPIGGFGAHVWCHDGTTCTSLNNGSCIWSLISEQTLLAVASLSVSGRRHGFGSCRRLSLAIEIGLGFAWRVRLSSGTGTYIMVAPRVSSRASLSSSRVHTLIIAVTLLLCPFAHTTTPTVFTNTTTRIIQNEVRCCCCHPGHGRRRPGHR